MQIDTETLETILSYSMTAARLARYLGDTIIVDALTKSINEITCKVAGLIGKPYTPRPEGEPTLDGEVGEPEFTVASAVDDLRQLVARADALATAAESLFNEVIWDEDDGDSRPLERLAHLVGATSAAVRAAMAVGDGLAIELSIQRLGA
jgi:hypothetical protein